MSEICNNCGHAECQHEILNHGTICYELGCGCSSFTARPDEPKDDKGIQPVPEMDLGYVECKHGTLGSCTACCIERFEKALALADDWLSRIAKPALGGKQQQYFAQQARTEIQNILDGKPAQDSATREDADQTEQTSP